ncbi:S-adenosyl-L-methionine-dependent methyltransferase [Fomitiporia mediterranea MF3/22]|uniref:S-adenosyl-L-methionine-dependent methyltransferase n=1 Tax=Fomitiporia mediterranea (strain MF3/22) TaxID=694068 RepID=UPI0004407C43|nr:S-adenosyl-L-methionine-dependent methyltransferase [Fomitiporia mediterranea MF3/22]EJD05068.1 S-adenosyl-L-methionine-dependent methyltransferase [Fomitiporia mediterranea MF3/22]
MPQSPDQEIVNTFDFPQGSVGEHTSSPSPQPSLYTLTDSIREQSVHWEYGLPVSSLSEIYKFPVNEEEHRRQDKGHNLFKILAGEYVPPLYEVLADDHDPLNPKTCLDLGCGTGTWILEVASAFPHVYCTAVDLVPLPARTPIPSNFRFEIDDISLGLEHFAGQFDVVHVRMLSSGVRDYYRLIDDTALALRSRGLAEFCEWDWRFFDIEKRALVPTMAEIWGSIVQPEGWNRLGTARSARTPNKRGSHRDAGPLLHLWISEHPSFEDIVYREIWIPFGNWMYNEDLLRHPSFRDLSADDLETLRQAGKVMAEGFPVGGFR